MPNGYRPQFQQPLEVGNKLRPITRHNSIFRQVFDRSIRLDVLAGVAITDTPI
jgi:hypothetical protein